MNNELFFAKTNPNGIIPSKRDEDGCYDIYACFDEDILTIPPLSVKLIPTGIATAFSPKYRMAIRERGSNTKSTLITMAGQIDSGYRGEIFVALYNANPIPVVIDKTVTEVVKTTSRIFVPYAKAVAQFAMEEVPTMDIKEISYSELRHIESERGIGALGSSNK